MSGKVIRQPESLMRESDVVPKSLLFAWEGHCSLNGLAKHWKSDVKFEGTW
jgi:hypothetical protein